MKNNHLHRAADAIEKLSEAFRDMGKEFATTECVLQRLAACTFDKDLLSEEEFYEIKEFISYE